MSKKTKKIKNPQNEFEKLSQKLDVAAMKMYMKDKSKGTLIREVMTIVKDLNEELHDLLKKKLDLDKSIYEKNNKIQMIMLNGLTISLVLDLKAKYDVKVVNLLSVLTYNTKVDIWKKAYIKYAIPLLNSILKTKEEKWLKIIK